MQRIAIFGMGGFAAAHRQAVQRLEEAGVCQLVALAEPHPEAFPDIVAQVRARGVRVYEDWRALLAAEGEQLDLVTVPTPVPLHAPMHRAIVERGLACYLEKPPTLDPDELDGMQAVERSAQVPTAVGFNYIAESTRQALKARLLAGEFGALRAVRLFGHWPRPESYFARNGWAARLIVDGKRVMDSVIGNALSHHVHNLLHWAGTDGYRSWAAPERVEALLWRGHAIESFDTAFVAAQLTGGVALRLAATHAGVGAHYHHEEIVCDNATLRYVTGGDWTIAFGDGREESGRVDARDLLVENLRVSLTGAPWTTLADCVPFVHLHALALVASAGIATVDTIASESGGQRWRAIPDSEATMARFVETGAFPAAAGVATPTDLGKLATLVR